MDAAACSLLASTFYLPSEEVAISVAIFKYNHYILPFSHIMIIVIISDENMLEVKVNEEYLVICTIKNN